MLGLVTNFALLHMLTPPEYVVYGLAFIIITVGVVVGSMGLPKTVVQFVAENMTLNQTGRARRAISLVLGLGLFGALGVSLAYLLVADLVGNLLNSSTLVALAGLTAGWIAISVVQEITAETFRGFHDVRLATLLGGMATGGKSGGLITRVLLLGGLAWLWLTNEDGKTDLRAVMLVSVGAGVASGLLAGWLLYSRLSSLGTQGTVENPMSAKDVLRDAFPFVFISLTSFVSLFGQEPAGSACPSVRRGLLFTGVRGRGILRSTYPGSCISSIPGDSRPAPCRLDSFRPTTIPSAPE